MTIFSRRVLQRLIEHNASFLSAEALKNHVDKMNRGIDRSIDTEWEVVVLAALSTLGEVQHEVLARSGRMPDISFKSARFSFTGDILAVNDSGIEEQNGWEGFHRELVRRMSSAGLVRGLNVRVGERQSRSKRRPRVLALPTPTDLGRFFDHEFDHYLADIAASPGEPRTLGRKTNDVDVTITYDPASPYVGANFHAYDSPQSLTGSPLFNALKQKVKKLREARTSGPVLIFACDGGSQSLRSRGGSGVTTAAIVRRFLQDHSITGVVLITVEVKPYMPLLDGAPRPYLEVTAFDHPRARRVDVENLRTLCDRMADALPHPDLNAKNAIRRLKGKNRRMTRTNWGGLKVSGNSIRLSARGVLELLSGGVSQEAFLRDHGFAPSEGHAAVNPLAAFLRKGRLIERVEIERSETDDDDWFILHFGEPDPAATAFVVPK